MSKERHFFNFGGKHIMKRAYKGKITDKKWLLEVKGFTFLLGTHAEGEDRGEEIMNVSDLI